MKKENLCLILFFFRKMKNEKKKNLGTIFLSFWTKNGNETKLTRK